MLASISINNFQRHKQLVFEPANGLTAIVGPSESGKSAIRRAISWVLYDYPKGSDCITQGAKECSVSLRFSDGVEIARVRTSNDEYNQWTLACSNAQPIRWNKPGGVPKEISDYVSNSDVQIDDEKLNLCITKQSDGFFLINAGATSRAKFIDTLTGVFAAEQAIKNIDKKRKCSEEQLTLLKVRQDELDLKIKQGERFLVLQSNVKRLIGNIKEQDAIFVKYKRLVELVSTLSAKQLALAHCPTLPDPPDYYDAQEAFSKLLKLKTLFEKYEKLQSRLRDIAKVTYPDISYSDYLKKLERLKRLYRFADLQKTRANLIEESKQLAIEADKVQKEKKALEKFKCPTCGQFRRE